MKVAASVRQAAVAVAALATVASLGACATPLDAYQRTRVRWTQKSETYEDFESRLFVKATLKTEPFRRAYADAYATIFDLDDATRAVLLEAELAEHATHYVVIVASFTHEIDWEELNPKREIWDVRVENDQGTRLRPEKVVRLDEDNPTWERLFPYLAPHDRLYEFRFPRDPTAPLAGPGENLHLVIAGAPAKVRLSWTLP